jgi:hypothetical protein
MQTCKFTRYKFLGEEHFKEEKRHHQHTFCIRKPATAGFKYLATPSVDAWAL